MKDDGERTVGASVFVGSMLFCMVTAQCSIDTKIGRIANALERAYPPPAKVSK